MSHANGVAATGQAAEMFRDTLSIGSWYDAGSSTVNRGTCRSPWFIHTGTVPIEAGCVIGCGSVSFVI